jgi:hypothetical protein
MKPQDFDRLSAYIDDELAPQEKAALEARLAREPELRSALQELRLTVRALRSLPRVRPPRSFTLAPGQVGRETARRAPLFPVLRLAAALSAVALAVVLAGDFATTLSPAAAPADEAAFTTAAQAEATPGLAAMPPADETAPVEEPAAESYAATPEAAATNAAGGTEAAGDAAGAAEAPTELAMAPLAVEETATPTPSASRQAAATPEPSPKVAEPTEAPVADGGGGPEAGEAGAQPLRGPGLSPLRALEAALAMAAVLFGLGAWFARRS